MSNEELTLRKLKRSIGLVTFFFPMVGALGGAFGAFYLGRQDITEALSVARRTEAALTSHQFEQAKEKAEFNVMVDRVRSIDERTKRMEGYIDARTKFGN